MNIKIDSLNNIINSKPPLQKEVTLTVYHPVESQCDNTPLITANGTKIDLEKLKNGEIKYCAVSRDVMELGGSSGVERVEKYIYGLKVVDGKLFIATEYIETEDNPKPIWSKEDFEKEENWSLLTEGKSIVIVPTLCCIADCIEQY